MGIGNDFTSYKEILLTKMVESDELVQAIANNKPNFRDDKIVIEPTTLLYKNIFPYMKKQEVLTELQSLITMRFDRFRPIGNKFKEGDIYFYILCHDDLLETYYGLRYDLIFDELNKLFRGSRAIGIGRLELTNCSDLSGVGSNFSGSVCVFHVTDFM